MVQSCIIPPSVRWSFQAIAFAREPRGRSHSAEAGRSPDGEGTGSYPNTGVVGRRGGWTVPRIGEARDAAEPSSDEQRARQVRMLAAAAELATEKELARVQM